MCWCVWIHIRSTASCLCSLKTEIFPCTVTSWPRLYNSLVLFTLGSDECHLQQEIVPLPSSTKDKIKKMHNIYSTDGNPCDCFTCKIMWKNCNHFITKINFLTVEWVAKAKYKNAWFQKISIPTPRKVIGNSEGGGVGSQNPKFLKESMKLNWKFKPKNPCEGVWIYSGTTLTIQLRGAYHPGASISPIGPMTRHSYTLKITRWEHEDEVVIHVSV